MAKKPSSQGDRTKTDKALRDDPAWQHVLKTVKPYNPSHKRKAADAAPKTPKTSRPAAAEKTPARAAPAPAPPRAPKSDNPGFDASTATKLRRGRLPLEGRLDLHGMSQAQAHTALKRFVLSAVAQDRRTLLVITGKGGMKEGGGVLRRMLPLWLEDADMKAHVLALTPAQPKDGGGGAFYLRLRKARPRA